jgi:hypothetical protein
MGTFLAHVWFHVQEPAEFFFAGMAGCIQRIKADIHIVAGSHVLS